MASSIDYGTLAVGALVGIGCKKQLKSSAKIAASLAASLAGATAAAVSKAAEQLNEKSENPQAPQGQNGQQTV